MFYICICRCKVYDLNEVVIFNIRIENYNIKWCYKEFFIFSLIFSNHVITLWEFFHCSRGVLFLYSWRIFLGWSYWCSPIRFFHGFKTLQSVLKGKCFMVPNRDGSICSCKHRYLFIWIFIHVLKIVIVSLFDRLGFCQIFCIF